MATLWLYSAEPRAYSDVDLAQAELAGAEIAGAVANSRAHLALRTESSERELLSEIGLTVGSASDLQETYRRLAEQVLRLIPADRLAITEVDTQRGTLIESCSTGVSIPEAAGQEDLSLEGTIAKEAIRGRAAFVVQGAPVGEVRSRFPSLEAVLSAGMRSFMVVPLLIDGDAFGTVELASTEADRYAQRDSELLTRIAGIVSPAVRTARAQSALEREVAQRDLVPLVLTEIARLTSSASDLGEVFRAVAEQTRRVVPFDRMAIWTVDLEQRHLVNTFTAGVAVPNSALGASLPLTGSAKGSATPHEQGSGNGEGPADPRGGALSELARRITGGLPGVLLVPMIANNEGVGMLSLGSNKPNVYTEREEQIADRIGELVARRIAFEQLSDRDRQAQEEVVKLTEGRQAASGAGESLERIVSTVSHELRSSLEDIESSANALLADHGEGLDAEAKKYLDRVLAASKRLAGVTSYLDNLKSDGGEQLQRQSVNLATLARSATRRLRRHEPDRKVTISISGDLPAEGDPELLRMMLFHLLQNSWNQTRKRSKSRIEIRANTEDDRIVFSVRDDDAGFDLAGEERLAGQLQRLYDTEGFEGSRLDLVVAQSVIERHGGELWVESAVDEGATYYFTLA